VDPATIALSNAPNGGDSKKLVDIANFKVGQIGLKYVLPIQGITKEGHDAYKPPDTETSSFLATNMRTPRMVPRTATHHQPQLQPG
jgi:hypothetical protein